MRQSRKEETEKAKTESGLETEEARAEAETRRDLALAALGLGPAAANPASREAGVETTVPGPAAPGRPPVSGSGARHDWGFLGRLHRRRGSLVEDRWVVADLGDSSPEDAATARTAAAATIRNTTPPAAAPARVSTADPEASWRIMPPTP